MYLMIVVVQRMQGVAYVRACGLGCLKCPLSFPLPVQGSLRRDPEEVGKEQASISAEKLLCGIAAPWLAGKQEKSKQ